MIPNQILGIPIIEEAAPGGFPAQQERELYSQIRAAIDMLRCPSCGSLNYQTTWFVFLASVEEMIECHNCGSVHQEILYNDGCGAAVSAAQEVVRRMRADGTPAPQAWR